MTDVSQPSRTARTPATPATVPSGLLATRRGAVLRYTVAVGLSALAAALTSLLAPWLERSVFLLFWPAVIASAVLGGFGPAMLSALLGVAWVSFQMIEPRGVPGMPGAQEIANLFGFVAVAALASWAVAIAERARRDTSAAAAENARLANVLDEQGMELSQQLEESQAMQEELELSAEELAARTAEAEAAERFTRGILESIADPFVVYDPDWRFRYINEAASAVFRTAERGGRDDLIGKTLWDEWPVILGTRYETEMRRAAADRTPIAFEQFNPRLGTWTEVHCYPLPDGGLGSQWKDITVRKQAEEASRYLADATGVLASSTDYESTLADVARLIVPHFADWCAISIVDDDGKPRQLAVAHVDPEKVKWAHALQERYPPDNDAKTGVPQVIRTGEPEVYPDIPDELLVAGAVDAEHLRITRELGLKSAMVVPLSTTERTLGAITIVSAESGRRYGQRDLEFATELARRAALAVENALHRKAALDAQRAAEAANQAKTQFLAVMSHELRTPLNAIGGYAELLLMGLRGTLTPDQQADLERIQRSQRNLLSLINDILNYAKLEAGHVEFDVKEFTVRPLVEELEPLVAPQLASKRISYRFEGCDENLTVVADAEKLRQILVNLLSNAVKFTEPDGSIVVTCNRAGNEISIVVRDTGIGVPEDKLVSIFEPFVQLERNLTSSHDGTGLGLAISRDLARGMGGELTVESVVGDGSAFELRIPAGQS